MFVASKCTKSYPVFAHIQSVGQHHNIRNANKSFENVAKFKHLGMRVTIKIIEKYL
jgi:hypothetical protein